MNHYPYAHQSQSHQAQGHYPQGYYPQAQHSQALSLTRNFLTDGYISYTFKPQTAEVFLVQLLFKVPNTESIEAFRDPIESVAYFVFNHHSTITPDALLILGRL